MDRFWKRLEGFWTKVRRIINHNWNNEPEGDRFRSLDVLYVLGAVRYKPTGKWQRKLWNAYCVVPVFSCLIFVLNAIDEIPEKFNLVKATWHVAVVSASTLCFVKNAILNKRFEAIQTVRDFINSKPFGSGDAQKDSASRRKCFQRLQQIALAIYVTMVVNQIVVLFPISGINELCGTPRLIQQLGPVPAGVIHFLFIFTVYSLWSSKYFCCTVTTCSHLYGFKTEYEIFVQGFGNILDNVYSDVEEEFPSTVQATPDWKCFQRDQLYWKYLKQRVNDQVKLHVQLVENMQLLEPLVKDLFGIIYYNVMIIFSPFIYVLMTIGFSGPAVLLTSGIVTVLLECYLWCSIIESLQDINETLELAIMDLVTKIPHSQLHHTEYVQLQTTLCIVKTVVRNHEPFSCGGVFPINVEAFRELLDIGYTVFTFLRDVEKIV